MKKKKLAKAKAKLREVIEKLKAGDDIEVSTDYGIAYITDTAYHRLWGIGVYVHMTKGNFEEWFEDYDSISDEEYLNRLNEIRKAVAEATAKLLSFPDYAWTKEDYGISVFCYPQIWELETDDDVDN